VIHSALRRVNASIRHTMRFKFYDTQVVTVCARHFSALTYTRVSNPRRFLACKQGVDLYVDQLIR